MSWWRQARQGLMVLLRRPSSDRALDAEVRHFESELADSYEARGMTAEEARRAARLELGSVLGIRDEVRAAGWEQHATGVLHDIRYALRRLAHQPGFTLTAVLTMGLGMGATAAIFTVADGVVRRPLPYPGADRLVALVHAAPGINLAELRMSPSLYFTYREESRAFERIAIWNGNRATVTGVGDAEEVPTLYVTHEFLDVLRVKPAVGRGFVERDGSPAGEPVVLLAHGYWKQRFGGSSSVLGRRLHINGSMREVVGVLPESFTFMDEQVSLVIPFQIRREQVRLIAFSEDGIGRLKPGVTLEQANADLARCLPLAEQKFPLNNGFAKNAFQDARIRPTLRTLRDHLIGDAGRALGVVLGAVAVLLLVACANVANLLLVRVEGRERELAVREALGAGWGRLARDLITESVLLGLGGGTVGLLFCAATLAWIKNSGGSYLPRLAEIGLNGTTIAFTFLISMGAGLFFGCLPVWRYLRGGRTAKGFRGTAGRWATSSRERHAVQHALLVTQVSLATVLLLGAGLLVRTYQMLRSVDPGFRNPEKVQVVRVSIPPAQAKYGLRTMRLQEEMLRKFERVGGVESVAITNAPPLEGGWRNPVYSADYPPAEGRLPPVRRMRAITPGYVAATGTRIVAGRDLNWSEFWAGAPVALISENMARELWNEPQAAVGRRIRMSLTEPWREVIGVLADLRDDGMARSAPAIVYWPMLERRADGTWSGARSVDYLIRSRRAGSAAFVDDLRQALREANGDLPLANVRTLQSIYRRSMARMSFLLVLLSIAAAMALLLGLVGIYGVMAYALAQRRKEIGIRLALGGQPGAVAGRFLGRGMVMAAAGVVIGIVVSAGTTRIMRTLLSDLPPAELAVQLATVLLIVAVAAVACWLPARRATRVNPMEVLRAD